MKKTFKDLKIGDTIYAVSTSDTQEPVIMSNTVKIIRDSDENLIINSDYGDISMGEHPGYYFGKHATFKRLEASYKEERNPFGKQRLIIFSNETDAIRYAKSRVIKHLNHLIKQADQAVGSIKSYRHKYYQELNIEWTDRRIQELERGTR